MVASSTLARPREKDQACLMLSRNVLVSVACCALPKSLITTSLVFAINSRSAVLRSELLFGFTRRSAWFHIVERGIEIHLP